MNKNTFIIFKGFKGSGICEKKNCSDIRKGKIQNQKNSGTAGNSKHQRR